MKILAVSDFIDSSLTKMVEDKTIEPIDIILSCGDIAPEYLAFLKDRLDRPLFYVKGNHDIRYTSSNPMGCENLHAKIISYTSVNIMGLEGSIWYNGGPNQYTDKEMKKIICKMWFSMWRKTKIHIIFSHAPPKHIHDAKDRCHMGFESFIGLIKKRNPLYFIHGHIHKEFKTQQERITSFDSTQVVNACGYTILKVKL